MEKMVISQTIDDRIRHITAIIIDSPYEEPFITVNYDTFEYVSGSGDVKFKAQIIHTGGICTDIDVAFPFYLIRGGDDNEIMRWRSPKHDEQKSDEDIPVERPQGKIQQIEADFEKPLSTKVDLSKKQLIEYLQKADIPDDAELTLQFDDGEFYLYFYWSEGPGAFGHRAVNFDIENKELIMEVDKWNAKDAE